MFSRRGGPGLRGGASRGRAWWRRQDWGRGRGQWRGRAWWRRQDWSLGLGQNWGGASRGGGAAQEVGTTCPVATRFEVGLTQLFHSTWSTVWMHCT